jgi:hypothetical protein
LKPLPFQKAFVFGAVLTMLMVGAAGYLLLRGAELATARNSAARNAWQTSIALRVFTSDGGGNYPDSLDELVRSGTTSVDNVYESSANGREPRWLYTRFLNDSASREYPILIAAKAHAPNRWVVAWNDSTISEINAAQRETLLALQKGMNDSNGEGHFLGENMIRIYNEAPRILRLNERP